MNVLLLLITQLIFCLLKQGKVKVKTVFFEYFFFKMNGYTLVNKRTDNGIWQNMYEFPLITNEELKNNEEILNHNQFESWVKGIDFSVESISEFKHILSHRKINARFWEIKCQKTLPDQTLKKLKLKLYISLPYQDSSKNLFKLKFDNYNN